MAPPQRPQQRPQQEGGGEVVNSEILALTYGALVRQLLADLEDVATVNSKLKQMGHNLGSRLIEEFLAIKRVTRCASFRDTVLMISDSALPLFLGVKGEVQPLGDSRTECSIKLREIPLADFVEIPEQYRGLQYCNLLTGVIEGALERVNTKVECTFVKDMLVGDTEFELHLKLVSAGNESYPFGEND